MPLAPPAKRSMTWALSSSAPAGDEGGEVGAQALQPQPGDEGGEVHGVGGDVAGAAGRARARRVGAPAGLLLARVLELGRQPVLRVLGLDHPDRARAGPSATIWPRLPDHRVAGIIVGQREHAARLARPARRACARPSSVVVSGLSQMTWMPRSRNALAAGEVDVVGRDDRHHVDPVLARASRAWPSRRSRRSSGPGRRPAPRPRPSTSPPWRRRRRPPARSGRPARRDAMHARR